MTRDEKPSGQFRTAPRLPEKEPSSSESKPPKKNAKHKVIADIHSGMVLLAPVFTPVDYRHPDPSGDEEGEKDN